MTQDINVFKKVSNKTLFVFSIVCVFLCLDFVLTLKFSDSFLRILTVSFIGFLLCSKYKLNGFFLFLITLFASAFLEISKYNIWNLGLDISLGLSFLLLASLYEEVDSYILSYEEEKKSLSKNIDLLEENIQKEKIGDIEKRQTLENQIEELKRVLEKKEDCLSGKISKIENQKQKNEEIEEEQRQLNEQILQKQKEIDFLNSEIENQSKRNLLLEDEKGLQERNNELLDLLNEARVDKLQSKYINESLLKELALEKEKNNQNTDFTTNEDSKDLIEKTKEIQRLKDKLSQLEILVKNNNDEDQQLKDIKNLYKQLKDQFNNKNVLLHQTRQELFNMSELYAAKEKDVNDKDYEDHCDQYLSHEHVEEDYHFMKEENDLLTNVITNLSSQLTRVKTENKKTNLKDIQIPLDLSDRNN